MKRVGVAALAAVVLSACTTVSYEGPRRPDSEVATIESDRTVVVMIDGKKTPYSGGNYATFKVLPGDRTVAANLNDHSAYPRARTSSQPLSVLFSAEAGKTYVTRPAYDGSYWRLEVIEKDTRRVVSFMN